MSDLAAKTCVPCRGGVPPFKGEELVVLQKQVDGWSVIEARDSRAEEVAGEMGVYGRCRCELLCPAFTDPKQGTCNQENIPARETQQHGSSVAPKAHS